MVYRTHENCLASRISCFLHQPMRALVESLQMNVDLGGFKGIGGAEKLVMLRYREVINEN